MSCWTCRYQQLGGDTFLGICSYFPRLGRPAAPIPSKVVDAGCKFEQPKTTQQETKEHGESDDHV